MKNLYFVAHQDDELLNTGVLLTSEAEEHYEDTIVFLCTDGSGSGVLGVLGDEKECFIHKGKHLYPLTKEEFSLARDREFLDSCKYLGVKKENVIIHKDRAPDGSLTRSQAEHIILSALSLFPEEKDFRIRAVSPYFDGRQNPDHKAIGLACERLFGQGLFSSMLLVTDSCFEGDCREVFPEKQYITKTADESSYRKILAAADCYGLWEPEKGRFAIGWHSVKDEFEAIAKNAAVTYEEYISR